MAEAQSSELLEALRRAVGALEGQGTMPVSAVVGTVNQAEQTCSVIADEEAIEGVRWVTPHVPAEGAKCLVVFRDGSAGRPTIVSVEASMVSTFTIAQKYQVTGDATGLTVLDIAAGQPVLAIDATGKLTLGLPANSLKQWLSDVADVFLNNPIVVNPETTTGLPLDAAAMAALTALKTKLDTMFTA